MLLKFKLLELRRAPRAQFIDWALGAEIFRLAQLCAQVSDADHARRAWLDGCWPTWCATAWRPLMGRMWWMPEWVTTPAQAGATNPGIARLEDPGTDFPYYNGLPVALSAGQWLFVLAMVVLGFLTLDWPIPWPGGAFGPFIPAMLMPALPLAALARFREGMGRFCLVGSRFRAFRLMVGFAVLNIVVSMGVGAMVGALTEVTPNRPARAFGGHGHGRARRLCQDHSQLLGEGHRAAVSGPDDLADAQRWPGSSGAIVRPG